MSFDENENRPESAERTIQVTNCTIYVGRVGIVIDPRLNSDCTSIPKTRTTEGHDGSSLNTSPKQTDFVGVRSTKPRSQRQSITMPYAARPKTTKFGPTSRQKSVCQRPATSQLPCCLHGVGRCSYEERFGAGSDNFTAGTDDCNVAARNGGPSRRNSSGRSTIWGTQNGGRLSPLRLGSRVQNVSKFDWPTSSKIPVPRLSQPKPPARLDRPVDLYAGSRLPVPIRPGPVAPRILRIERTGDVRPPSQNEGRSGLWCATADKLHDTDDNLNGQQCFIAGKLPDTDDTPDDMPDDKPNENPDDKSDETYDLPDDTDDKPDDKPDENPDDKSDDTDDKPDDMPDDKPDENPDDKSDKTYDLSDDTDDKPDDMPDDMLDDKPDDTDDKPHDVVALLDYDDTAIKPGQPCVHIDETAVSATPKQGCPLPLLDNSISTTDSQPVVVAIDILSDASNHPSLKPVDQNEPGMTVLTLKPIVDDDDSQLCNVHSSGHQSATVLNEILL